MAKQEPDKPEQQEAQEAPKATQQSAPEQQTTETPDHDPGNPFSNETGEYLVEVANESAPEQPEEEPE